MAPFIIQNLIFVVITLAVAEANDGSDERITGNTMQFCLHYGEGNEAKVKQAYKLLKEGGKVQFPLGPCEFSPLCADFIDKFGVRWCLLYNCLFRL